MRKRVSLLCLCVVFLLSACAHPIGGPGSADWQTQVDKKYHQYQKVADAYWEPLFQRAGLSYPPSALALLIFKNTRHMEIWAKKGFGGWHYITTWPVLAASGNLGPKLHAGDYQVPEGVYSLNEMNPHSHFDLSLLLNYPNRDDIAHARQEGRPLNQLGGNIFIHGYQKSIGCIAIGNTAIERLWVLVYAAGYRHVTVIIAPNDFRTQLPKYPANSAEWMPDLYGKIRDALEPFQR